ncbi:MAG TPA: hypothetical protein VJW73_12520 [Gemmatimonadaceae bacterium]|nr:hypothetical protein [Gemmatimonadaceae bacterium]
MIIQSGGPPDTSAYYHVAYAWAAVLYAGYSAILWARARRLRRRTASRTRTAGS